MEETEGQLQYQLYLESEHWAQLRSDAIAAAGGRCKCGSTQRLQVHHVRYRHPWESCTVEDVEVLCRPCHAKVHGVPVDEPRYQPKPKPVKAKVVVHYFSLEQLHKARNDGEINRADFERERERLRAFKQKRVKFVKFKRGGPITSYSNFKRARRLGLA